MSGKNRADNKAKKFENELTLKNLEDSKLRPIAIYIITPLWLLGLVLTLSPFTGDPAAPIKYLITSIYVFLISITLLVVVWFEKVQITLKKSLIFVLFGYLFFLFLGTLGANNKLFALSEFYIWLTLSLIAIFTTIFVVKTNEVTWVLTWVIIAIALSNVYGFFQIFGIDPFPWSTKNVEEYRGLPSSYANPNFAGHAILFAVITGMAFIVNTSLKLFQMLFNGEEKRKSTHIVSLGLFVTCFLMSIIHLYLTRMRSARVALLAVVLYLSFYLLWGKKLSIRKILTIGGICITCVSIILILLFILIAHGYPSGHLPSDNSLNLRLNGYLGAVNMILKSPIIGYGPGNYRYENIPFWTKYEKLWFNIAKKRNYHVHCDPLEAMIDGGIGAGIFYFALIFLGFLTGLQIAKNKEQKNERILGLIFSAIFLAFSIDGIFGFNLRVPVSSALFFLYLGLTQVYNTQSDWKLSLKTAKLISLSILLISFLLFLFQSRSYYAELQLQKARGGIYWAQRLREEGRSQQSYERILERTIEHAKTASDLRPWEHRFPEITARVYTMRNEFPEALQYFDKAIAIDRYNPELLVTRTQSCINWIYHANAKKVPLPKPPEEILNEAQLSAEHAILYCDLYPDAYEGLARALYLKTVYLNLSNEEKETLLRKVIENGDKALETGLRESLPLLQILIQAHQTLKEYPESAKVIQKALSIDPKNIELWSRYAQIIKQLDYPQEYLPFLERSYAKFKADSKNTAPTLAQIALMIYQEHIRQQAKPQKAMEILYETVRLAPEELATWGALIQALPKDKKLSIIRELANKHSKANLPDLILKFKQPLDSINWLGISQVCLQKIEDEETKNTPYKTIVLRYVWCPEIIYEETKGSDYPELPEVFANLVNIYRKLRFDDRALACMEIASNSRDKRMRITIFYTWAEMLHKKKRLEEAYQKITRVLEEDPNHIKGRALLVRILAEQNKVSEAKFEFESLKQLLPEHSPTITQLQQLLQNYTKQVSQ